MDLGDEIENYLQHRSEKSTNELVAFLTKLWNSGRLKSSTKYNVIMSYFIMNVLPKSFEDECTTGLVQFLRLTHPVNCLSIGKKKELAKTLSTSVKKNPSSSLVSACLELASNECHRDFFKSHLKIYCDLIQSALKGIAKIADQDGEFLARIISELYFFAKLDSFKELFLESLLLPLSNSVKSSTTSNGTASRELIKSIYFYQFVTSDSSLEIFDKKLSAEKQAALLDTFIATNKSRPEEIMKLLKSMFVKLETSAEDDLDFLSQTKQILLLLKTHGIDLAPMKREAPDMFSSLAERVNTSVESLKQSMDFAELLQTLTSFINCDAFLFEKNIYNILMDCMMREKSPAELTNYEELLSVVIKIYGKDVNQFLKKLLRSVNEKLDSFTLSKKRKRKLVSGSEADVTAKKLKLSASDVPFQRSGGDWSYISHIWPSSTAELFADTLAGLNVTQTIKVWTQLSKFLDSVLNQLKEQSNNNENVLFKLDFVSSLLSALFVNTRLHEHLMQKQGDIAATAEEFNKTQHLFYEILLNIEYNNRVMQAFLKLSNSYESFLMLYFYHHSSEDKNDFDTLFIENQSRVQNEWKIIQQRIKNFGKPDEKNYLNLLIIQRLQKNQLFSDVGQTECLQSILNDEKQIEFLLQKNDTGTFMINSLGRKELKVFAQYLIGLEDDEIQSSALRVIARGQTLMDGFVEELLQNVDESCFKKSLEILVQLPLACASDDNKKKAFETLLKNKASKELQPLIEGVVSELFSNDSYKAFFKDFSMQQVSAVFEDGEKFAKIYHPILSNAARKMNIDTLNNFNWILQSTNNKLLPVVAQVATEVPMTPASGVNAQAIAEFKSKLMVKMMENFSQNDVKKLSEKKCIEFIALARMCGENSAILKDETKIAYSELLQKFIKNIVKSPSVERAKLLLMTLKDGKKFNLNDEMKASIVEALLAYLKSTLTRKMSPEAKDYSIELEQQLFTALKPFKSNFQEGCVNILRQGLIQNSDFTSDQLQYCFKIFQVAFSSIDKSSHGIIKSYTKFLDEFAPKALSLPADTLIQVIETNNSVLKDNKIQLDNTTIDEILCLLTNPQFNPSTFKIEDFFRFYSAVGETLFVIANVRQNYFKLRVSQFFNIYRSFIEAVYFYKNDSSGELSQIEISLLLKLALQLENVIKMILKTHSLSIKVISLYIVSSIVNIFVKRPKTLSVGYKFKVNIKNICYQLLQTFDDKTRKHVYSVSDETTREVYDGLFNEIRRRV